MKNDYTDQFNTNNPYLSDDQSINYSANHFSPGRNRERDESLYFNNKTNDILSNKQFSTSTTYYPHNKNNSFTNFPHSDYITAQDRNYLKFRNEELNKDLLDKINHITQLNEKIMGLENIIGNLQKTIQSYHEKLAVNEKQKVDINVRNRKINELEEEINRLKADNIKVNEALNNKDNMINEFQGLITVSNNKFKLFEETNQNLKDDNDKLKSFIDDLQNKLIEGKNNEKYHLQQIYDMKNLIGDYTKKEEELMKNIDDVQRNTSNKLRSHEDSLKNDFSKETNMLNKTIEHLKLDNDKLNFELKNLRNDYNGIEKNIHDKEMEFHRIVENKDIEYNNLLNTLRDVQNVMQDLELNFNSKMTELLNKIKFLEENETKLLSQLKEKERISSENEVEIINYKEIFENCQKSLIDLNQQIKLKDEIIERVKGQFNEVLNELNQKEESFNKSTESKNNQYNQLLEEFKEVTSYKDNLIDERQHIMKKNDLLSRKVSDLTDILENKYKRLENEIYKERSSRDICEKSNRELLIKLKDNEERYNSEMNRLKTYINSKEKDFESIRNNLINKLEQNKIKIEEQNYVKQSLLDEMNIIKEWAHNVEKHVKTKNNLTNLQLNRNFNHVSENIENLEIDKNQKQTLNNLKEIIKKIDNRINFIDNNENYKK